MIARRYWLYLALALSAGLVLGAAWPPPPLPRISEKENEWTLPSQVDIMRHVPQDMAVVTNGLRWKGDAGSATGEKSAWRLAGIVRDSGPAILVMAPDGAGKVQRIAPGEALPDGSILHAVEGDRAMTKRDNCITTYQLFQTQAIDKSSGCVEPEASDQGTSK